MRTGPDHTEPVAEHAPQMSKTTGEWYIQFKQAREEKQHRVRTGPDHREPVAEHTAKIRKTADGYYI